MAIEMMPTNFWVSFFFGPAPRSLSEVKRPHHPTTEPSTRCSEEGRPENNATPKSGRDMPGEEERLDDLGTAVW